MPAPPWYTSPEDVKRALDIKETARSNGQVGRNIGSSSRDVETLTRRRFYPQRATRKFDWPNEQFARSWRLWLDANELISVETITSGGVTIPSSDYFLRRPDDLDEPPFSYIEIDLASSAAFNSGPTHQQSIEILGLYGYRNDEEQIGVLAGSLAASPTAIANITYSTGRIGTGDLLRINNERMIINERSFIDSTQNLQNTLAASKADNIVTVTNGAQFAADIELLIGAETMLVTAIAGNNLIVERAWDGSILAGHTSGVDVFLKTGTDVDRASLGTVIAAHNTNDPVYRFIYPEPIRDLTVARTLVSLSQEGRAFARPAPSSRNRQNRDQRALMTDIGVGLAGLEDLVRRRYRRLRVGAV